MKETTIRVLKVEPNNVPCMARLNNDLDSLQKAVSIGSEHQGLIEIIDIAENVAILCNEEGKLIGFEGNRRLGNDIIVGVFYVVGTDDEGNLCSLTDEQMAYYNNVFFTPETITQDEIGDSIVFEFIDLP